MQQFLWHVLGLALLQVPCLALKILEKDSESPTLFGPPHSIPLLVSSADGVEATVPVNMQLAITEDEHHHGLMFRNSMDENAGMVFIYPDSQKRVLYMRNTEIPLDAGWFTSTGALTQVMHLKPEDETWMWSDRADIKYGLEMNLDWFSRHKVEPGKTRIDMSALRSAVQSRGFNLQKLGFEEASGPTDSSLLRASGP
mmetsp:Transcript_10409/g.18717  ORF Transcript_10409/g.18717 Transcript_10409/m.18717 type:complete len:198 (+) Transcript_10409:158-751(+)